MYTTTGYNREIAKIVGRRGVSSRLSLAGKSRQSEDSRGYLRASYVRTCIEGAMCYIEASAGDEIRRECETSRTKDDGSRASCVAGVLGASREETISPTTLGADGWGSRAARRDTKEISRPPCWRWLRDGLGLTIM